METDAEKPKPTENSNTLYRLFLVIFGLIIIFIFAAPQEFDKILKEILPPSTTDGPGFPISPKPHPKILANGYKTDDSTIFRLPNLISPIEYELTIQAFLPGFGYQADSRNMTFEGEVLIKSEVLESTNQIFLHAQELNILQVKIMGEEKAEELQEVIIHRNYIEIKLAKDLERSSKITIFVKYFAKLRNDSKGFYDTTYIDENGQPRVAVVTQMEPDSARLAVPCFDEPAYKAVWKMTIIHPIGTQSLSNNDLIDTKEYDNEFLISTFLDSPKMSSYLLAFFISDFAHIQTYTRAGIRVRVWARAEEIKNMEMALISAVKIIDKFEDDFGVAYPMTKLDMVEVKVFEAGAMENWGLVTYRDGCLGYNEKLDNLRRKRFVRIIIAHELAHQWFGNLVTMEFWTRIWLNEGFATLFELTGADVAAKMNYNERNHFLLEVQNDALRYEYLSLFQPIDLPNHPMTFELKKSDKIGTFFSGISYQKAASVLSMIRKVVGKSVFDEGLRNYLKENQYKNVVDEELYKHLQKSYDRQNNQVESLNIESFAKSWTTKTMFPVVFVKKIAEDQVALKQFVFAKQNETIQMVDMEEAWDIPIYYQRELGKTEFLWLKKDHVIIENAKFVVLNVDSDALYRVRYDDALWQIISEQLNQDDSMFSVQTKYRLVSDSTVFNQELAIVEYLKRETEKLPIIPYIVAISSKEQFDDFYKDKKLEERWKNVVENYANDEKIHEVELDYNTIVTQCKFQNCLPIVQKFIDQMKTCGPTQQISQCSTVPAQLRELVYCVGKKYDVEFKELVEKWRLVERRASEVYYFDRIEKCSPKEYERKSAGARTKHNFEMEQYEEMMKELRYRGIH